MLGSIRRGIRNVFRNPIRSVSVTIILGVSLAMVVVMLAARNAVDSRIEDVKTSFGNTITVSPAGARGFIGGGEPLHNNDVETVQKVEHVLSADVTIDAQLRINDDTNLQSAIEGGALGNRQGRVFRSETRGGEVSSESFTPPIFAIGTNNAGYGGTLLGSNMNLTAGTSFDASSDALVALVGSNLATKNNLNVGSTFTAFGSTITVNGIFDAGSDFANNAVVFPLQTLQTISEQSGEVTEVIARVDSVDNLDSVETAIHSALGDSADLTSSKSIVSEAIKPLESIQTISTTSVFGAFGAATLVVLLTMVMIVRERRKEIAVLKALGAGESTIITQFIAESSSLSLMGSVVGVVLGFMISNPILHALLSSNQSNGPQATVGGGPGGGGAVRMFFSGGGQLRETFQQIQAVLDWRLILATIGIALLIAILGSAIPAWLIGKVRPAEVLRSE